MYKHGNHCGSGQRKGNGPSSAWLHDPKTVLKNIPLKKGQLFVDLGCGSGDYTLAASDMVGSAGKVFALDKWEPTINNLAARANKENLENITSFTADILSPLPFDYQSVNVVFIATVLHIFNLQKIAPSFFKEIHRILKHGGTMAILECKKEDRDFGPPKEMCHSPEEIQAAVQPYPFAQKNYTAFKHTYLLQFTATPIQGDDERKNFE